MVWFAGSVSGVADVLVTLSAPDVTPFIAGSGARIAGEGKIFLSGLTQGKGLYPRSGCISVF